MFWRGMTETKRFPFTVTLGCDPSVPPFPPQTLLYKTSDQRSGHSHFNHSPWLSHSPVLIVPNATRNSKILSPLVSKKYLLYKPTMSCFPSIQSIITEFVIDTRQLDFIFSFLNKRKLINIRVK